MINVFPTFKNLRFWYYPRFCGNYLISVLCKFSYLAYKAYGNLSILVFFKSKTSSFLQSLIESDNSDIRVFSKINEFRNSNLSIFWVIFFIFVSLRLSYNKFIHYYNDSGNSDIFVKSACNFYNSLQFPIF